MEIETKVELLENTFIKEFAAIRQELAKLKADLEYLKLTIDPFGNT